MVIQKSQLALAALIISPLIANANPPHTPDLISSGNRWSITAFDDSSPTHAQWATQGICFYNAGVHGTQQQYYWVSDTFPDWNGRATQEGDQVFMHGDYAKDVGHDGMQLEITGVSSRSEGYGHWKEWREDGKLGLTIGFANAKIARVGKCRALTHLEALDIGARLELKLNENNEFIVVPSGLTERQIQELEKSDQSAQLTQQ